MKTLDKYFIQRWVTNFLIGFFALYGLVLVGDLVNNLLRNKYSMSQIFLLISLNAPLFWSKILPISACMASLFTFQKLTAHSELIVYLASSYSRLRFSTILIILCSIVGCLQYFNLGYLEPIAQNIKLEKFERNEGGEKRSIGNDRFWIKSFNYIGSFSFYDQKNKTMYNPEFYFYNENFILTSSYQAKYAYFISKKNDINVWSLNNVVRFQKLEVLDFPTQKKLDTLPIELKEGPEQLSNFQSNIYSLTMPKFYRFISSIKETGINLTEYYFYYYDKWAHVLLCLILGLFPWLITRQYNQRHGGAGKTIIYGLLFSLFGFGVYIGQSKLLLSSGVPPFYSALLFPLLGLFITFSRSVRA